MSQSTREVSGTPQATLMPLIIGFMPARVVHLAAQLGIADRLAATAPDRYVTTAAPAKRAGRLFVNWLCNGRGITALGAYSPRALRGLPIAAPVSWRELERGIRPDAFTIFQPPRRHRAIRS